MNIQAVDIFVAQGLNFWAKKPGLKFLMALILMSPAVSLLRAIIP